MQVLKQAFYLGLFVVVVTVVATLSACGGGGSAGLGAPAPTQLLGADTGFGLYQLDNVTVTAKRLSGFGLAGFSNVEGLAFDANSNTLYGTDTDTNQLIIIDPVTGAKIRVLAVIN